MHKCLWCQEEGKKWSYRRDAQFCSDDCRYRYHNAQKKVNRQVKAALAAIAYLHSLEGKAGVLGESAIAASNHIATATVRRMVQS